MLQLIDSCQNNVSVDRLRCLLIQVEYFLKLSADYFWSDRLLKYIFLKFIWNTLCLWHYGPALLKCWFQADLGRENSASPVFMLLIGQNLTGEFMRKFIQHLETCLLWQLKLTEFFVNLWCFYCLFPLDAQNEIQLLSTVFCYSWLVCLLNFWLRNASLVKVSFRFRMALASFSFFTLLVS